jgi:hypothetical protein
MVRRGAASVYRKYAKDPSLGQPVQIRDHSNVARLCAQLSYVTSSLTQE